MNIYLPVDSMVSLGEASERLERTCAYPLIQWEKGSRLNFEKLPYDDQKKLELDWEYDCEKLTWDNFEQQKMRQRQESERKSGQTKSQFDKGENEGGQRTSGPTAGVGVGNFKDTASANESGFFGAAGAVAAATATAGAAGGAIVNGVNNVARTAGRVWAPLGSALTGNQY